MTLNVNSSVLMKRTRATARAAAKETVDGISATYGQCWHVSRPYRHSAQEGAPADVPSTPSALQGRG